MDAKQKAMEFINKEAVAIDDEDGFKTYYPVDIDKAIDIAIGEYNKLKKIVDKLIEFEKQIEDFADKDVSYARFRSWDVHGDLLEALWEYAPHLKHRKPKVNNSHEVSADSSHE